MKTHFDNVPVVAKVDFVDIAEGFAEETSVEQAELLYELFAALRFKCGDNYKYQNQLYYISKEVKLRNLKLFKTTIETLAEFLKDGEG